MRTIMNQLTLSHQLGETLIQINSDLISSKTISQYCLPLANQIVLLCDKSITPLYAEPLLLQLKKAKKNVLLLEIESNEGNKSRETKAKLEDKMFAQQCGRDTLLIAMGGGIVTDIGGFIGATYCRGISTLYVPTTLLAMVDASVGGKTGINSPYGKNLIGSFYQPQAVFCDTSTLATLSRSEISNGFAEIIKHALIKDLHLFKRIESLLMNTFNFKSISQQELSNMIKQNIIIKAKIVEQDEREASGIRQLLNFGHTVAHAIEKHSNYMIPHGQAVLVGMHIESNIALQLKLLSQVEFNRIKFLIKKIIIREHINLTTTDSLALINHMSLDKKNKNNQPHFILLEKIGDALQKNNSFSFPVNHEIIKKAIIEWCNSQ